MLLAYVQLLTNNNKAKQQKNVKKAAVGICLVIGSITFIYLYVFVTRGINLQACTNNSSFASPRSEPPPLYNKSFILSWSKTILCPLPERYLYVGISCIDSRFPAKKKSLSMCFLSKILLAGRLGSDIPLSNRTHYI